MRVLTAEVVSQPQDRRRFTGAVELEMLATAPGGGPPDIARVRFVAGATTYWHSHPGGQVLLVLDGAARVGTDREQIALEPGTLVETPAGERHWHGAAADAGCVLLALTWGTTDWEDRAPDA